MRRHRRAQLLGEHLGTQADAEKRPLLAQGDFDPVDFAANVVIAVVGTHRAAEDDRAGVAVQCFRQSVAKPRPPDIEAVTERAQRIADPARRRGFLVQNDQNRQQARWLLAFPRGKGSTTLVLLDRNDIDLARYAAQEQPAYLSGFLNFG